GLALYRIAQEALANAARHAPRVRTALGLEVSDGHVSLVAETTGPFLPQGERERTPYGLIGMRERATALGGEFSAGPTPGGLARQLPAPVAEPSGSTRVIRVALVDDQAIVRAGLARILSPADGFEVVAECADGREALDELPALELDV